MDAAQTPAGQATSPRGEVSVSVGVSGALDDLRLTAAARSLEAGQLARLILATVRDAQRAAGVRIGGTEHTGDGPAPDRPGETIPADDDHYFSNSTELSR